MTYAWVKPGGGLVGLYIVGGIALVKTRDGLKEEDTDVSTSSYVSFLLQSVLCFNQRNPTNDV